MRCEESVGKTLLDRRNGKWPSKKTQIRVLGWHGRPKKRTWQLRQLNATSALSDHIPVLINMSSTSIWKEDLPINPIIFKHWILGFFFRSLYWAGRLDRLGGSALMLFTLSSGIFEGLLNGHVDTCYFSYFPQNNAIFGELNIFF